MADKKLTEKVSNDKTEDMSKYYDKYVAMVSFNDKTIIAYDEDPVKVMKQAKKKGFESPVLHYIHNPDSTQIYNVA